jgi:hypothetical protein
MKQIGQTIGSVAEKVKRKPQPVEIERSLERLSNLLDGLFRIPGTTWRFGLDTLMGLIPGVGDTITSFASFYILAAGVRYRVPKVTLLRMALNIGVDYVVGVIPVLGDAFDLFWRSNERNIGLLRQRATVTAEEAKKGRKSDWLFVGFLILVLILMFIGSVFLAVYILKVIINAILGLGN